MSSDPRRGRLFVASAPSGAGKTTVVERLIQLMPDLRMSRSYTSRPARHVEEDGVDYNFVSRTRFEAMVAGDQFLEWADVFGNLYGTSTVDTEQMRISGLKTAATYEQLMEAFQQAFAPAKDAGVALGQMVPLVTRLTQVAQVSRVPMNMLNEELRSFTTGTMTRRTTRIMPYMESIGLTNEKIREFIKNGTLFEETMNRTVQIGIMAAKSVNTWTVALSNLIAWFRNIMGVGI